MEAGQYPARPPQESRFSEGSARSPPAIRFVIEFLNLQCPVFVDKTPENVRRVTGLTDKRLTGPKRMILIWMFRRGSSN